MATDNEGQPTAHARASAPETGGTAIEIRNLVKTFADGTIVAVDDVDLAIGGNEFVVLVGPSGCGKTTTLRCICGLEVPDSGSVTINGEDVTYHEPKDRNLAFVFQDIALFPHMTVRENIRFGLDMATKLSGEEKETRVRESAEMLGIGEMLDRRPAELSGGQQQRVSIGRAMVTEPAAFLLDEPFSALDANLRDRMRTEVKRLQRELERAMIFVTHDQEEAMTLGDTIVVMNDGDIMQQGTPYEIYNEPANRFVADFIGSPSTNFFSCVASPEGGRIAVESDLFRTVLDDSWPDELPEGETVELGVRPEHFVLGGDDPLFEASIDVIEPHGPNDAIYLSAGGTEMTAIETQSRVDVTDSPLPVGFDEDHVWLFDGRGRRVR
ncbi:ABC transporter ATP-binding protein [Candidatus Halobonum tyrrellensis]|uniref:ABC-type D-xylose/L-arabinose transporter n=1 Tax=Candidatus Halobonum tyrrellensis G22 TaxID=1324957 RepID=V4HGV7_9EURY|nr:ABC transporter ATP-binding protein [Candidatus Halobonum tyrrellensis]ESP87064.1 sugar ABC transporter ATP-binding protein [Candidatus Halobonum tyrrellensis G22]